MIETSESIRRRRRSDFIFQADYSMAQSEYASAIKSRNLSEQIYFIAIFSLPVSAYTVFGSLFYLSLVLIVAPIPIFYLWMNRTIWLYRRIVRLRDYLQSSGSQLIAYEGSELSRTGTDSLFNVILALTPRQIRSIRRKMDMSHDLAFDNDQVDGVRVYQKLSRDQSITEKVFILLYDFVLSRFFSQNTSLIRQNIRDSIIMFGAAVALIEFLAGVSMFLYTVFIDRPDSPAPSGIRLILEAAF